MIEILNWKLSVDAPSLAKNSFFYSHHIRILASEDAASAE